MNTQKILLLMLTFLILILLAPHTNASTSLDSSQIMNNVSERYLAVAESWRAVIQGHANTLFWSLATMSMVWTFGIMALRKADIGEFFAEFIRFTISTGFFWWLLSNGPRFASAIIDSLRAMASTASGSTAAYSPSGIADIGFKIYFSVKDKISLLSPIDSTCAILASSAILVVLVLVAVNMLILLISGWILAYAGIFFLGFGGARWTSDIAIGYYKSVLSLAAQAMTMVLLVGIGQSFVDQYASQMSKGSINMSELCIVLVVSIVLLSLVQKVPPLIGALAGGNIHALGSGFGIGTIVGGAAMGAGGFAAASSAAGLGRSGMALFAQKLTDSFPTTDDHPETAPMLSHPDLADAQQRDQISESGSAFETGYDDPALR